MPDTHPGDRGAARLELYWTEGEGKAKWAASPHPYTTLVALLSKFVPPTEAHGLAANYYHRVFGRWPGKHDGGMKG